MGDGPDCDVVLERTRQLKRTERLCAEDLHSACMSAAVAALRRSPRGRLEDPDTPEGRAFRRTPALRRLMRSAGPRHFEGRVERYLDEGECWVEEERDRVLAHYARVTASREWDSAVERQRLLFTLLCAVALVDGPAVWASYRGLAGALAVLGAGAPGPTAARKTALALQSRGWMVIETGRPGIPGTGRARKTVLDLKPLLEPVRLSDEERDALTARLRLPDLAYVLLGLPVPGQTPRVPSCRPRVAPALRPASPPRVPQGQACVVPVSGSLTRGQDLLVGALTGPVEGTRQVHIAPLGALHVRVRTCMITRGTSPEIEKAGDLPRSRPPARLSGGRVNASHSLGVVVRRTARLPIGSGRLRAASSGLGRATC